MLTLAIYALRIGAPFIFAKGFNSMGLIYMVFTIASIILVYSGGGFNARGEKLKWGITMLFYIACVYLSIFLGYPFIFTIYLIGFSPIIGLPSTDEKNIQLLEFISNVICVAAIIISVFL